MGTANTALHHATRRCLETPTCDAAQVVRLSRERDEVALEHYMCSYSTQGITLDATLRCRPAGLIRSRLQCAHMGLGLVPGVLCTHA